MHLHSFLAALANPRCLQRRFSRSWEDGILNSPQISWPVFSAGVRSGDELGQPNAGKSLALNDGAGAEDFEDDAFSKSTKKEGGAFGLEGSAQKSTISLRPSIDSSISLVSAAIVPVPPPAMMWKICLVPSTLGASLLLSSSAWIL